jgi:hypothetical protein
MSSAQNRRQAGSLLLSLRSLSLTHAPVRSLFWAQTKAALLGKKSRALWRVQQPRNEMCGGDGARFYSASLALVLWRRVKSTTLGRTSLKERADQRRGPEPTSFSTSERAEMMLSEVEIAFYRATTTMETAATTSLLHLLRMKLRSSEHTLVLRNLAA